MFNRLMRWSVIGSGIASGAFQLVRIREFITQFQGNEIIISLVLFVRRLSIGDIFFASREDFK